MRLCVERENITMNILFFLKPKSESGLCFTTMRLLRQGLLETMEYHKLMHLSQC